MKSPCKSFFGYIYILQHDVNMLFFFYPNIYYTTKKELTFDQYMIFIKDYMSIADTKQKEMIKTDEYKKADYDTKEKKLTKARSDAKKKAVQNIMSKTK